MDRGRRTRTRIACLLFVGLLGAGAAHADDSARDTAPLWTALAGGEVVALMRHARAPGTGDPEAFELDACATQRNLSAAGRDQAKAIGATLRRQGIDRAVVHSSQWCRCLDTARLLDIGPVIPTPILNSFFDDRGRRAAQTAALRQLIAEIDDSRPRVLVTHQVNITALTGVFPASGEIVFVRRNDTPPFDVIGRTVATD